MQWYVCSKRIHFSCRNVVTGSADHTLKLWNFYGNVLSYICRTQLRSSATWLIWDSWRAGLVLGSSQKLQFFNSHLSLSALWCGVTLIWSWSFVAITVLVSAYFHLFSMFAHGPMMYSQRLRCQILLGTQRGCSCLYWQCQRQSTFLNSASWANLQCRKLRCVEVDWRSHCMLSGSLGSDLKLWRLDESHAVKTVTGSCALAAKKLICIHLRKIV